MEQELKPVYVVQGREGQVVTNVLEISEDWAWIVFLRLKKMPSQLSEKDRKRIEASKAEGVRVVPMLLLGWNARAEQGAKEQT